MRSFFLLHNDDVRVIADIEAQTAREAVQGLRARIDQMKSQNMRQVALAMWREKIKTLAQQ
jgi:hypothetical protein